MGTNDVFNYLIDQADLLGASDIHIENQRESIRIRMRVDGALHTVAELSRDRYRVIMATFGVAREYFYRFQRASVWAYAAGNS